MPMLSEERQISDGKLLTRLEVTRGTVTVSHGPLPWNGWRQIVVGMIDQLYCKEIIRRGKHGPTITYEVWAALTDGAQTRLVGAGLALLVSSAWILDRTGVVSDPFVGIESTLVAHPWWVVVTIAAVAAVLVVVDASANSLEPEALATKRQREIDIRDDCILRLLRINFEVQLADELLITCFADIRSICDLDANDGSACSKCGKESSEKNKTPG